MVSSLLEVDNLMDKSILTFCTGVIKPGELKNIDCSSAKKRKLFLYGFSAIVFRPVFWIISVYSAYQFLAAKDMSYLCGVVVGFVFVVIYKDISDLLKRYVEMYKNQKQRVLGMIEEGGKVMGSALAAIFLISVSVLAIREKKKKVTKFNR